jgi:hypothetical protein
MAGGAVELVDSSCVRPIMLENDYCREIPYHQRIAKWPILARRDREPEPGTICGNIGSAGGRGHTENPRFGVFTPDDVSGTSRSCGLLPVAHDGQNPHTRTPAISPNRPDDSIRSIESAV